MNNVVDNVFDAVWVNTLVTTPKIGSLVIGPNIASSLRTSREHRGRPSKIVSSLQIGMDDNIVNRKNVSFFVYWELSELFFVIEMLNNRWRTTLVGLKVECLSFPAKVWEYASSKNTYSSRFGILIIPFWND